MRGATLPRTARGVLWGGLLLALAGTAGRAEATAASRVVFKGGGSLGIEGVEYDGEWVFLRLASGGEMAVPASRLLKIDILSNSRAPRTDAPPAPPLPAAPAPSQAPPATPADLPAVRPSPAAPGQPPGAALEPDLRSLIDAAASHQQIHPELVAAMVKVESNFNPGAVSARGAQGLLQLMPETSRAMGVSDPFDPRQNLEAGARYFRTLLDRFRGDIVLALAAYNAGEEAVRRHGGLPPFSETRTYVDRVLTHFARGF